MYQLKRFVRGKRWPRLIIVCMSVFLMGLVLRNVEWRSVPTLLSSLRWEQVGIGFSLILLSQLVAVFRWKFLVQNSALSYWLLLRIFGAGLFTGTFLPTGIGGDGVRIALLSRMVPLPRAAVSVVLDRLFGLLGLTALLAIGLWIGRPLGLHLNISLNVYFSNNSASIIGAFIFIIVFAALSYAIHLYIPENYLSNILARVGLDINWKSLLSLQGVIYVTASYSMAVVSHLGIVAGNWLIIRSIGIDVGVDAAIWLVLAVAVSLLFPLSVNGLGVREATFVMVLTSYGVSNTPALLAALLTRLVLIVFALLGGIGLILYRSTEVTSTSAEIVTA